LDDWKWLVIELMDLIVVTRLEELLLSLVDSEVLDERVLVAVDREVGRECESKLIK